MARERLGTNIHLRPLLAGPLLAVAYAAIAVGLRWDGLTVVLVGLGLGFVFVLIALPLSLGPATPRKRSVEDVLINEGQMEITLVGVSAGARHIENLTFSDKVLPRRVRSRTRSGSNGA